MARSGIVLTAKRPSTTPGGDVGVAGSSSNRRSDKGATASTERRGQKLQRGQPEQIKPRGQDPLGKARRRWRRKEARSTNPHGQMEALDEAERLPHRAAAELAGARRNRTRESSAIRDRQRGLGLGRDRVRERVRGRPAGPAGPVKPTRVDLTSGPRLSAPVFVLINSKNLEKTLISLE
jgi:hypothetical protein